MRKTLISAAFFAIILAAAFLALPARAQTLVYPSENGSIYISGAGSYKIAGTQRIQAATTSVVTLQGSNITLDLGPGIGCLAGGDTAGVQVFSGSNITITGGPANDLAITGCKTGISAYNAGSIIVDSVSKIGYKREGVILSGTASVVRNTRFAPQPGSPDGYNMAVQPLYCTNCIVETSRVDNAYPTGNGEALFVLGVYSGGLKVRNNTIINAVRQPHTIAIWVPTYDGVSEVTGNTIEGYDYGVQGAGYAPAYVTVASNVFRNTNVCVSANSGIVRNNNDMSGCVTPVGGTITVEAAAPPPNPPPPPPPPPAPTSLSCSIVISSAGSVSGNCSAQ